MEPDGSCHHRSRRSAGRPSPPPPSMAALLDNSASSALFLAVFLLLVSAASFVSGAKEGAGEEFTEELLLKPLPDRKVLAHFHFHTTAPVSASNGRHHHLFPKAIAQLVQKFSIKDLELSFTQGRWNYERWGGADPLSSNNAKPPGVELWTLFDLPVTEIDPTWKDLTHALSGLFCASINFLESSTSFSAPSWAFRSNVSNLRYGALPRGAVCTENLTPWLKLLPCRDKAGLAFLLYRPSIYRGYYHSQKLRITSNKLTGIFLEQTLTIILQPDHQRDGELSPLHGSLQPNWSISSLFKKKVTGQCSIAKSSRIFIEMEENIAAGLKKLESEVSLINSLVELYPVPNREIKETNGLVTGSESVLYEYVNNKKSEALDVGINWKLPFVWSCAHAPYHVNRFLLGSGNERGSIAISLQSTEIHKKPIDNSNGCTMQAVIFQVFPWYVKVYYHTLQIFFNGRPQNVSDVVVKIQVRPSEDKLSPGTLELLLRYPCMVQSVTLTLDFDKGFLHIDEYPPDANQGFDIPSALVTFPDFYSSRSYLSGDISIGSPLLLKFKENNVVRSYTEVLLVPLTTPDFSMPYNVITFTCTVLALYFGSLLNALRRRLGEEERLLNKASPRRGLIPILLSKLSRAKEQKDEANSSSSSSSIMLGPKILFKVISVAVLAVLFALFLDSK